MASIHPPTEEQSAQLAERFDASCKAIGDGIDRLQRDKAIAIRALAKIAATEGCQPGHVSYLSKTTMSEIAAHALAELDA